MTFLTLDRIAKKLLFLFLLCLFSWCLFSASGTCSASGTQVEKIQVYQITEQELTTLENNISTLKSINEKLQMELAAQKRELHVLKEESSRLLRQLNELKQQSQTQESSLTNANKLLAEYATEAKRERLRIKAQRNGWATACVLACIGLAVK